MHPSKCLFVGFFRVDGGCRRLNKKAREKKSICKSRVIILAKKRSQASNSLSVLTVDKWWSVYGSTERDDCVSQGKCLP